MVGRYTRVYNTRATHTTHSFPALTTAIESLSNWIVRVISPQVYYCNPAFSPSYYALSPRPLIMPSFALVRRMPYAVAAVCHSCMPFNAVQAGDCIVVPKGWMHEVFTVDDSGTSINHVLSYYEIRVIKGVGEIINRVAFISSSTPSTPNPLHLSSLTYRVPSPPISCNIRAPSPKHRILTTGKVMVTYNFIHGIGDLATSMVDSMWNGYGGIRVMKR